MGRKEDAMNEIPMDIKEQAIRIEESDYDDFDLTILGSLPAELEFKDALLYVESVVNPFNSDPSLDRTPIRLVGKEIVETTDTGVILGEKSYTIELPLRTVCSLVNKLECISKMRVSGIE